MPWPSLSTMIGPSEPGGVRAGFDRLLENLGLTTGRDDDRSGPDARTPVAFTMAIIALAAKLSKADGVSSPIEADMFYSIYKVPAGEMANVRYLFDLAKQDARGFEYYADQIARLFRDSPQLKSDVLEALFNIAAADGVLHGGEDTFLKAVSVRFGLVNEQYMSVRAQFVVDNHDPFVVLGLRREAGNDEIKARYRQLVKDTHPDTMVARGVPPEMTGHATRRLATITDAYRRIAKERGL